MLGVAPLSAVPLSALPGSSASGTSIAQPSREITAGPPMRGAPWFRAFPQFGKPVPGAEVITATTPQPPVACAPEILFGPPMRGAPWFRGRQPLLAVAFQAPPPAPNNIATPSAEIVMGPPMPGPWFFRSVRALGGRKGAVPGATPSTPATGPGRGKSQPFIPRVPKVIDSPRRAEQISEKVSDALNALMRRGVLVKTDNKNWTIRSGGFAKPRPPTVTDDSTIGATPGCSWVDTAASKVYFCVSNTVGAAVWTTTGLSGSFP